MSVTLVCCFYATSHNVYFSSPGPVIHMFIQGSASKISRNQIPSKSRLFIMSLIMDGMDQSATNLSHLKKIRKYTVHLWHLWTHLNQAIIQSMVLKGFWIFSNIPMKPTSPSMSCYTYWCADFAHTKSYTNKWITVGRRIKGPLFLGTPGQKKMWLIKRYVMSVMWYYQIIDLHVHFAV